MKSLSGFRILPILMVVAAICFGVRFSQVMAKVYERSKGGDSAAVEYLPSIETAAGDEDAAHQPSPEILKSSSIKVDETPAPKSEKPVIEAPSLGAVPPKPADEKPAEDKTTAPKDMPEEGWKGADDLDDEYSDVKMEMFSDLSKRRKDLETKEKELVMREALIKAAQAEMEQKTVELNQIKTDIETLLKKQTEQEDKRISSLVKIYEGMKAKDAARILDSLETDVLLQVMTKMSERKSSSILAAMDAERARSLTILMAEQNKLPELPSLPLAQ